MAVFDLLDAWEGGKKAQGGKQTQAPETSSFTEEVGGIGQDTASL